MIFTIHLSLIFHCFRFLKPFHLNARYWISDRCLLRFLFPHWDDEFEFIYVLSGMMEFRVRQKAFLVSSGEGFFLNTGEIHSACTYQSYDCRFVIYRICPSVLFQTEDNPLYQKYIKPLVDHPSFGFLDVRSKSPLAEIYP